MSLELFKTKYLFMNKVNSIIRVLIGIPFIVYKVHAERIVYSNSSQNISRIIFDNVYNKTIIISPFTSKTVK